MPVAAGSDGLRVGAEIPLDVSGLDVEGDGVARTADGLVVFVEGGLPGDRLQAEVTRLGSGYARARAVQLLRPSSLRVEPRCPIAHRCGGCPLMGLAYPAQLDAKRRQVVEALRRIGGFDEADARVAEPLGMSDPWNYRNKAQYPVRRGPAGEVQVGFYRRGTHEVVPADDCAVQHPLNVAVARSARRALQRLGAQPYDERRHDGLVRHLVVRTARASGESLLAVVTREPAAELVAEVARAVQREVPQLVGAANNVNPHRTNVILGPATEAVWGRARIEERVGSLRLSLSVTSFFQVNSVQAERLYEEVRRRIAERVREGRGPARLVDVYCGVGGIGLYAAGEVQEVFGIEISAEAVEDARRNARLNGIEWARFVASPAEPALAELARETAVPGRRLVAVVNPPRRGLEAGVVRALVRLMPERLVYVSCNPATLARDLRMLVQGARRAGAAFRLGPVQPVDMFPHTAHIEVVAHLDRA